MINRMLVEQRLAMLKSYLQELEKLGWREEAEFLSETVFIAAAESFLRRALEVVFDVGRHLLAKTRHIDLAGEYKAIAGGLERIGAVDRRLGARLVQMAGYRNRLVHLYNEVGERELYGIIRDNLGDFEDFIVQIRRFLAEKGD